MRWISELHRSMQKDRKVRYVIYTIIILLILLLVGLGYVIIRNAFDGKDVAVATNEIHLEDSSAKMDSQKGPVTSQSLNDTTPHSKNIVLNGSILAKKNQTPGNNNHATSNGKGNTVSENENINNGSKPRAITQDIIDKVESISKNKNITIAVFRRSDENESNLFAAKIVKALKKDGYINSYENGIMEEMNIGGNSVEDAKKQSIIDYSFNGTILTITVPSNLKIKHKGT